MLFRSCKNFYIETLLKELGIFNDDKIVSAYESIDRKLDDILLLHKNYLLKKKIILKDQELTLPYLLWTPKMHKDPPKQRFIAVSIVVPLNHYRH